MVEKIIKRDGRVVDIDDLKIFNAVCLAVEDAKNNGVVVESSTDLAQDVTDNVINTLDAIFDEADIYPTVEQIQDLVVDELKELNPEVAKYYSEYRERRTKERLKTLL